MTQGLFGRLQQELELREQVVGLTMADILQLPTTERKVINWMMRTGAVTSAAVAAYLGQAEQAQSVLAALIAKGYIRQQESAGELSYTVQLAPRRQRELPASIWQALTEKLGKQAGG